MCIRDSLKEVHDKGFNGIVVVVSQRDFIAVVLLGSIVQTTSAHPCTQAAWVAFVAHLKDDLPNLRPLKNVRNPQLLAQLRRCV